jgi:hypothetical protein
MIRKPPPPTPPPLITPQPSDAKQRAASEARQPAVRQLVEAAPAISRKPRGHAQEGYAQPDEWDAAVLTFAEPVGPNNFNRRLQYPSLGWRDND